MKISVIIPTYKPQEYLWECLDSLMNQTLSKADFEIILVLNGCSEPFKSKIERYIVDNLQGLNVVFVQTEIAGVSNARNIGLDISTGEYITFVDDDDILSTNYLNNLLEVCSPSCIACSNSYCFVNTINERRSNFVTRGYERCENMKFSLYKYRSFLSPPWAKLIHKSIIGQQRFPIRLKKSEDSFFCLCISPNIQDMKLAPVDTIYYQRERPGSAMRTKLSIGKILKEHIYIEWMYMRELFKHPFRYNIVFLLSRIVACGKNCCNYIKESM